MRLGLGIDTGGTYTDGVLYDFAGETVLARAKRVTTPHNLAEGIEKLLDALPAQMLSRVSVVSLSTTLATNACVEDVGGRTALVLMGYDGNLMAKVAAEYGLDDARILSLPGAHGQRGQVVALPDYAHMERLLEQVAPQIDAVGVAEYWGVRNPEFEMEAKARIRRLTGLPVAAAHELSTEINSMRRAATTLLNARLIPLIDRLIGAVESMLRARGIGAPLVIVRGDGSVMTQRFARECPVETLLSGPAASVMGAMRLSGERDLIAVDIGGTTTDLALVRGGRTQLVSDGVDVGRWRTGTRAIQVRTVPLGGDTMVGMDDKGKLCLGQRRALPLCMLAADEPGVSDELARMLRDEREVGYSRGTFYAIRALPRDTGDLTCEERAVLEALNVRPHSLESLAQAVGTRPYFLRMERLLARGIVIASMLTPTDIMLMRGEYSGWADAAPRLGLSLLAQQLGMRGEQLMQRAMDMAGERLYRLVVSMLLSRMLKKPPQEPEMVGLGYHGVGDELDVAITTPLPLVLIGAPTHIMAQHAAKRLGARMISPPDAAVAGAVGAITGNIIAEERAHIRPKYEVYGIDGYSVHTTQGFAEFETLAQAQSYAAQQVRQIASDRAQEMGAAQVTLSINRVASRAEAAGPMSKKMLLDLDVIATAVGKFSITGEGAAGA